VTLNSKPKIYKIAEIRDNDVFEIQNAAHSTQRHQLFEKVIVIVIIVYLKLNLVLPGCTSTPLALVINKNSPKYLAQATLLPRST
jgi:hypothetical protein